MSSMVWRRWPLSDARHQRELMDWFEYHGLSVRHITRFDGRSFYQWAWEHEKETFYRSFFINGDPVAEVVYFKILDLKEFYGKLWKQFKEFVVFVVKYV